MGAMVYAKTQLHFMASGVGKIENKRSASVFSNRYFVCSLWADGGITYSHLFFTCSWTACFWLQIKLWLRINRRMMTLTSAIRGLHSGGNNLEARMKRVSLGLTVYLIWEERNKRFFYGSCTSVGNAFRKFQVMFYTVFHFYEKDHHIINVG